jgi:flagellar motor switch protein FliN/FliY
MGTNMTPEEIEAMMNSMAGGNDSGDGGGASDTSEPSEPAASPSADSGGNMTPEQIEAMMNSMTDGDAGGGNPPDGGGDDQDIYDDGYIPNEAELGILGEIYNISMGSAATAVSSLLSMKVDITAPNVEIVKGTNLIYQPFEPAVGVEIKYKEGIEGVNIFILSQIDVMKIFDIMLGGTGVVDETGEFNEMHMSAIGEVMNQMMGQSSMALANFLNTKIDISTPETYRVDNDFNPSREGLQGNIIATRFKFIVGDIINSEMLTTCSMQFAESMINMAKTAFGMSDGAGNKAAEKIVENMSESTPPPAAPVSAPAPPQPAAQPVYQQQPPPAAETPQPQPQYAQPQYAPPPQPYQYPQPQYAPPPSVNAYPAQWQDFGTPPGYYGADAENNVKIRIVPVDVTVEIGKTKKLVSEILELGEGNVIELDRQSAEPVDIFVNGVLFAKGSVVVIEENFAVKITEIL